jgi:hypothetical protein
VIACNLENHWSLLVSRLGELVERHTPAIVSACLAVVQDGMGVLHADVSGSAKRFVFRHFFAPEN